MRIDRTDQADPVASAAEQGTATPLRSASVSGGQTRFNGESSLIVNGSEDVFGELNVQGTLNVSGTNNTTGTTHQDGPLIVNGDSTFVGTESHTGDETHTGDEEHNGTATNNGPTTNNGDVTNIGKTTQQGDYEGTGKFHQTGAADFEGGDVTIKSPSVFWLGEGMSLEPSALGGGTINFWPTGSIFATGFTGAISTYAPDGSGFIDVGHGGVTVGSTDAARVMIASIRVFMPNLPDKP